MGGPPDVLAQARATLRPDGGFVLKEWERCSTPIHGLGYLSDRCLTGDRVRFGSSAELRALVGAVFGPGSIERELRLPPWRNNLAFLVRATPASAGSRPRRG